MGIKYYYWTADGEFSYDQYTLLVDEEIAVPCGLIAKSRFNDTFALYTDQALTN